jgi:hypothetical protein
MFNYGHDEEVPTNHNLKDAGPVIIARVCDYLHMVARMDKYQSL